MKLGFWKNERFGSPLVMDGTAPQPSYAELAALVTELRGKIVRLKESGRAARVAELFDDVCFIRTLMRQTMKLNAVFEMLLRTAEPVARVKLFEVLSDEQF